MNDYVLHDGEIIDLDNLTETAKAFRDTEKLWRALQAQKDFLAKVLWEKHTVGDTKTRKIRCETFTLELTAPANIGWRKSDLKRLWIEGGSFAEEFLRIESVAVNKIKFNTLHNTQIEDPKLQAFVQQLLAAQYPFEGKPGCKTVI